jgi:hypothetical protein
VSDVTAISIGAGRHAIPSDGLADLVAIPDLGGLQDAAGRCRTQFLWLVDARAVPWPTTLPALLDHADAPAASVPVDAQGSLVDTAVGRVADDDAALVLERVAERRVPMRHTTVTSLLIECELVASIASPNPRRFGTYAGSEWTGRLFARRRGMLVPASRVRVENAPAGSPVHVLRTARSAGWRRGETLRELHRSVMSGLA